MSTVLVTGANGNLGCEVVDRLAKDGYRVIAVTGARGIRDLPTNKLIESFEVDLDNEKQANDFISSLIRKEPGLQAAILLVGGFMAGKIQDTGGTELEKMIRLNFYTAYHIVKPLLPFFMGKPDGGQFILIGSKPALRPSEGKNVFAYALSKAMIFQLAEIINAEGKDKNVNTTVVVPSTIDTKSNRAAMPDADPSKWVPASQIADVIAYVLSPAGRMLRETVIKIYNRS